MKDGSKCKAENYLWSPYANFASRLVCFTGMDGLCSAPIPGMNVNHDLNKILCERTGIDVLVATALGGFFHDWFLKFIFVKQIHNVDDQSRTEDPCKASEDDTKTTLQLNTGTLICQGNAKLCMCMANIDHESVG